MKDPVVRWATRFLGAVLLVASCGYIIYLVRLVDRWTAAFGACAVVLFCAALVRQVLLTARAAEREDPSFFASRAERLERGVAKRPGDAVAARGLRGLEALFSERWSDAIATYSALDDASGPVRYRAFVKNNLAYAIAMSGDGDRAMTVASEARLLGEDLRPKDRALLTGTFGIACVVSRRYGEALQALDDALAAGGSRTATAIRHYFRAEALRAVGRIADARASYEQAARISAAARWRDRALESLATIRDVPYRAA